MRKISLTALALLLALVSAGCAASAEEFTIDEIAAANTAEAILDRHAGFSMNAIYYDESGSEVYSSYQALSKSGESYSATFEDSDGYTEFLDGEIVYLFDPADNSFAEMAFYPGQYDEYVASFDDRLFLTDEAAEIESADTKDGIATVTVRIPRTDFNADFMDSLGFGTPEVVRVVYTIDPASKEVQGYELYAAQMGAEKKVLTTFMTYLSDPLGAPDYVNALKNPAETRTITVVYPDGAEKAYTLDKDARFTMSLPDEFAAFLDPEGEIPVGEQDLAGKDATIYLRAGE